MVNPSGSNSARHKVQSHPSAEASRSSMEDSNGDVPSQGGGRVGSGVAQPIDVVSVGANSFGNNLTGKPKPMGVGLAPK